MRVEPFALDLDAPLATAAGDIRTREGFLVGVEAEGVRGLGEATPLPGWTESLEACRQALESGHPDALDSAEGDAADGPVTAVGGTQDHDPTALATPAAAHGAQLARLDLTARNRGVPLARVLAETAGVDGSPAASVPVNATVGDGDVSATVDAARQAVADGFDCLKLKVGARSLAADLDRVDAVREALPEVGLRLDANGTWDVPTADRAVRALADRSIDYLEQPLPADDLDGLASLRGRGIDVAVDESLGRMGIEAVLATDAADVAVLKPMVLGGPATTLSVARRLDDHGIDPVVTTTVDGAVARAAAVHVAACLPGDRPCGLATGDRLAKDFGPDPVPVEAGSVRVPGGPGNVGDRFDDLVWSEAG